jgi:hypothetical protein
MSILPESALAASARHVIALCRFRDDPQNIVYSPALMAALLLATSAIDALGGALLGDASGGLAQSLLASAIILGLCGVALALRGLRHRYVQTSTALLGAGIVVSLVQLPILGLLGPFVDAATLSPADMARNLFQMLLRWAGLATLAWQVLVYAHIVRHAMDSRFGFALVLVVTWMVANWALADLLLGT